MEELSDITDMWGISVKLVLLLLLSLLMVLWK